MSSPSPSLLFTTFWSQFPNMSGCTYLFSSLSLSGIAGSVATLLFEPHAMRCCSVQNSCFPTCSSCLRHLFSLIVVKPSSLCILCCPHQVTILFCPTILNRKYSNEDATKMQHPALAILQSIMQQPAAFYSMLPGDPLCYSHLFFILSLDFPFGQQIKRAIAPLTLLCLLTLASPSTRLHVQPVRNHGPTCFFALQVFFFSISRLKQSVSCLLWYYEQLLL